MRLARAIVTEMARAMFGTVCLIIALETAQMVMVMKAMGADRLKG